MARRCDYGDALPTTRPKTRGQESKMQIIKMRGNSKNKIWTWDCMRVNDHVVISVCPLLYHEREDFFRLEIFFLVFRAFVLFLVFKSFVFRSYLSSFGL